MQIEPQYTPYDAPAAGLNPIPHGPVEPVNVPAGSGVTWVSNAWDLFKASPWMMIALWVLLMVVVTAASMIPLAGQIVTPALMAGFMIGIARLDQGQKLEVEALLAGFKSHGGPLLMLGALFVLIILVLVVVCGVLAAVALQAMGTGSSVGTALGALLFILLGVSAFLLVVFAMWWAPCLVVFNDQTPLEALKNAIRGILRNLLSTLVYGLILTLLYLMVAVTLGLGLFVVGPLVIVSAYTSYKDIFRPV